MPGTRAMLLGRGPRARRSGLRMGLTRIVTVDDNRPTLRRRKTMKRRQFNQALAATVATLGFPGVVKAQSQKLKVGIILPRSGYLGFIGQSCQKGADLAPGVIKEMLGVDVELMNADF